MTFPRFEKCPSVGEPFKFAIVGGGLTATSMLCQFVEKACKRVTAGQLDPHVVNLAVFEKTDEFGPGVPHNHRYLRHFHITNMCAADMGVYADRPGDFQMWVYRNLDRLRARFPVFPEEVFEPVESHGSCRHYPRAFMGEYLQTRFHQAVTAARNLEISVALYPGHEVIDIRQEGEFVRVFADRPDPGGRLEMAADAVLLATGHWFPASRRENYFDSPWPAKDLPARIPPGAELAVIGTSLSAIETVLTLTADGRFVGDADGGNAYIPPPKPRKITLYSRSGLLPKVRGKTGAYKNKYLTPAGLEAMRGENGGGHTLEATFRLLNSELERAYGHPIDWAQVFESKTCPADALRRYLREAESGDGPDGTVIWQTVLYQTFPFIREWYLKLTSQARKHFDRDYTSLFFTHAATQPRVNAAKLLALLKTGLVRVVRLGRRYQFYRDDSDGCYHFDYIDRSGHNRSESYRYVVNARGQEKSLATDPSELARNLMASDRATVGQDPVDPIALLMQNTAVRGQEHTTCMDRPGSLLIEPRTHRLVQPDLGPAAVVYAVGAMTRGQIIDASMALGISCSTATIADNLLRALAR